MKIGIATQPLWGNYGGLLQNYALQQVLRNLGHDPITLDLHSGTTREYYLEALLIRWAVKLHAPRRNSFLPWFPTYAPKRENTTIIRFIKDNIALTRGFWVRYPRTLVKEYGLEALIVGSDQVWRPSNNRRLTDKFFNFARHDNVKRIGYAVSFGSGKWECRNPFTTRKCRSLLQRFDGVSVRERQGLNVVAQLGGQAVQVLDPTLLLGAEGFRQLIANKPASGEKYLGSYILDKQTNKQTNKRKLDCAGAFGQPIAPQLRQAPQHQRRRRRTRRMATPHQPKPSLCHRLIPRHSVLPPIPYPVYQYMQRNARC